MLVNHLYAFFLSFRKTGRVKLQGFTDLLAPIKTDRFTTSIPRGRYVGGEAAGWIVPRRKTIHEGAKRQSRNKKTA